MSDKPTYKEFRHRREGFVKTGDGRCFAFKNTKPMRRLFATLRFLLVCIPSILMLTLHHHFWSNIIFDVTFLIIPFYYITEYAQYRTAEFAIVKEDSHKYKDVEWAYRKNPGRTKTIMLRTIFALIIVFLLANGFCVTWVRSMIENDGYVALDTVVLYSGTYVNKAGVYDDEAVIVKPEKSYNDSYLYIKMKVNKTPDRIHITLDGQPVTGNSYRIKFMLNGQPVTGHIYKYFDPSWIWDQEYFPQEYTAYIDEDAVHDGSVLEMTCGSLYRRWVFHLMEEGA